MINENIKKYRKQKGFTQEELAVRLHVVRQTVSKWEQGLSVPDADVLLQMAELLEVPASKLLGMENDTYGVADLTDELTRVNALLAEKNKREQLLKRSGEKRGLILLLSFAAVIVSLAVQAPIVSIVLSSACLLAAITVLYRNLALLTAITTDDMKLRTLRITTLINIIVLLLVVIVAILTAAGLLKLTENSEKMLAMLITGAVMIFAGIVSPKLPFTRHTGLRLPWTVQDEATWNVAHRIIGCISLPITLLYIGCALTIENFEAVSIAAVLAWIGIPAVISLVYFWRKTRGKE